MSPKKKEDMEKYKGASHIFYLYFLFLLRCGQRFSDC
ncbi:hypothetical protein JOC54_004128 [Alkalihalobacillus xiaoxiensis]|uniref:Uncharacterized protein n=1 Tax=Shouchella xiaoxiensis TaxID=766895 RepID=A0ABS2SZA5_9BACI|nr:hypothetical protein [Shouchella xiaoxiensis]